MPPLIGDQCRNPLNDKTCFSAYVGYVSSLLKLSLKASIRILSNQEELIGDNKNKYIVKISKIYLDGHQGK